MPERTEAETRALELAGIVGALVSALQMIEQGYVYRGSEKVYLNADAVRMLASEALKPPAPWNQSGPTDKTLQSDIGSSDAAAPTSRKQRPSSASRKGPS